MDKGPFSGLGRLGFQFKGARLEVIDALTAEGFPGGRFGMKLTLPNGKWFFSEVDRKSLASMTQSAMIDSCRAAIMNCVEQARLALDQKSADLGWVA